jgi:thioredoxin 1
MIKVIRFTADWCGPCKTFGPAFDKVAAEFPDIKVEVVDLSDGDTTKANKYGVLGIPAAVFLNDNGEEVTKIAGMQPEAVIREAFDKLNGNNAK